MPVCRADSTRLSAELFNSWKKTLNGKLEELSDQGSVDAALDTMRKGIWLHVYTYEDELLYIQKVPMPEGEDEEYIFIYTFEREEDSDKMVLQNTLSVSSWVDDYIQYINIAHFDLSAEEAIEELRRGRCIESPVHVYIPGRISCPLPEYDGLQFIFQVDKKRIDDTRWIYILDKLDNYKFSTRSLLGYYH